MGDKFEMVTAFSRDGPKKVYVQHLLKTRGKEINELLEKKAYFYVCGDAANMAREVNAVLAQILAEQRGISEAKAEEIVKNMRAANQYQVRQQQKKLIVSGSTLLIRAGRRQLQGHPGLTAANIANSSCRRTYGRERSEIGGARKRTTITRACMRHGIKESVLGASRIFVLYGSHKCFFSAAF